MSIVDRTSGPSQCTPWCASNHQPGCECVGQMVDIACTGDTHAINFDGQVATVPVTTVYLREEDDGQHAVRVAVTGQSAAAEASMTAREAARLHDALGAALAELDAGRVTAPQVVGVPA